jgi:acetoacetyl-CoA synthetase
VTFSDPVVPLWTPSPDRVEASNLVALLAWLRDRTGVELAGYGDLWRWSTDSPEEFWGAMWERFEIASSSRPRAVLGSREMPGAEWFPGAAVNFAEHILRRELDAETALVAYSEREARRELSWGELRRQVGAVAASLRQAGVGPGDRVAAYACNTPEVVVAFLAAASLGAVWASCASEFGPAAVIDRLGQLHPKALFASAGYRYAGRDVDRRPELERVLAALPSVELAAVLPDAGPDLPGGRFIRWESVASGSSEIRFQRVSFDHPLWVLFTSGTTGLPKGVVHGHGGMLLGLLPALLVHYDLKPEDRFFWHTTTGWVMWNLVVSSLLLAGSAVLYDGSPGHPEQDRLWRLATESGATFVGTSSAYIEASRRSASALESLDWRSVRTVCATGSPLSAGDHSWLCSKLPGDVWVFPAAGATDVCVPFLAGTPTLPVRPGRLPARGIGVRAEAFDEAGRPVLDEIGELVFTAPFPSMPVRLWGDQGHRRYREAYFERYPGVWRQGDWVRFHADGSAELLGRSDSTVKRKGVRIGTAELYRVVEAIPGVRDSLAVDAGRGGESLLLLFVVLDPAAALDDDLRTTIRSTVRRELSPRHVPDEIARLSEVPRTLNGKKIEVPVRRLLLGEDLDEVVSLGAVRNPAAFDGLLAFRRHRMPSSTG